MCECKKNDKYQVCKILGHLPVVGELGKAEACRCCCDEEAVVHGQHRQHFSKGFLKSKFELIQRLKFLSVWIFNFCIVHQMYKAVSI